MVFAAFAMPAASGMLLGSGSNGSQILIIDPSTGQTTFLASTGLDFGLNNAFEVDSANHLAYRLGSKAGVTSLSTIDLLTGTSQITPIASAVSPFAVFNGQLLGSGSNGSQILIIDPSTGQTTFLASTGLDFGLNNAFEVDSANHLAYRLGSKAGVTSLSTIDLLTGTSQITPIASTVSPFAIFSVPEPASIVMILFCLGGVSVKRWRRHN